MNGMETPLDALNRLARQNAPTHARLSETDAVNCRSFFTAAGNPSMNGLEEIAAAATAAQRSIGQQFLLHENETEVLVPRGLDPIPYVIGSQEWEWIASGLRQRGALFDRILADLLGPQELLRSGMLPDELVLRHPDFLRAVVRKDGQPVSSLSMYGAHLSRGPDGRVQILSDLIQRPDGLGSLIQGRTILTNLFPSVIKQLGLTGLAPEFRSFRASLVAGVNTHGMHPPRVVVQTPGINSPGYFEHAYLAMYLGYTLVQGQDLLVQDGRVWVKGLDGLQAVDVVLRFVKDIWSDPLELREESTVGLAGIVEVARQGRVSIVNPIGSTILENRGLLAYLPAICRSLLGEELLLPQLETWWCGEPKACASVLARLHELTLRTVDESPLQIAGKSFPSPILFPDQVLGLPAAIQAEPWRFVAQARVSPGLMPVMDGKGMALRPCSFRTFSFKDEDGFHAIPGGIAETHPDGASDQSGSSDYHFVKDVWVCDAKKSIPPQNQLQNQFQNQSQGQLPGHLQGQLPGQLQGQLPGHLQGQLPGHLSGQLQQQQSQGQLKRLCQHGSSDKRQDAVAGLFTSRSVENLYWCGRYGERVASLTRSLRVAVLHDDDLDPMHEAFTCDPSLWRGLLAQTGLPTAQLSTPPSIAQAIAMVGDPAFAGGLQQALQAFYYNAQSVREHWGQDTWQIICQLQIETLPDLSWRDPEALQVGLEGYLRRISRLFQAFAGQCHEGMSRSPGWYFLDLGRNLERGVMMADLLAGLLMKPEVNPSFASDILDALLKIHENLISYRRTYRTEPELPTVMHQLLAEPTNPRSLLATLNRLILDIDHIQGLIASQESETFSTKLRTHVGALEGMADRELEWHPDPLLQRIRSIHESLTATHNDVDQHCFKHTKQAQKRSRLVPLIQQQQPQQQQQQQQQEQQQVDTEHDAGGLDV